MLRKLAMQCLDSLRWRPGFGACSRRCATQRIFDSIEFASSRLEISLLARKTFRSRHRPMLPELERLTLLIERERIERSFNGQIGRLRKPKRTCRGIGNYRDSSLAFAADAGARDSVSAVGNRGVGGKLCQLSMIERDQSMDRRRGSVERMRIASRIARQNSRREIGQHIRIMRSDGRCTDGSFADRRFVPQDCDEPARRRARRFEKSGKSVASYFRAGMCRLSRGKPGCHDVSPFAPSSTASREAKADSESGRGSASPIQSASSRRF